MTGKVGQDELLDHVFTRTGVVDEAVRQGPAVGEDAAAIDVPAGTLVVSSDPISLAASHIGTLGVHVACNDVAVAGVDPTWLTVILMLPPGSDLEAIMDDINEAATELGVTIVGGHTEYVGGLDRPIASLTAMGIGEFLPTGGAAPGDELVLTKGAAIEGTAILAADFGEELDVDDELVARAEGFLAEVSVVPEVKLLRERASAMHDPTEGGVLAGLQELALANGLRVVIEREKIPVRPETEALASAAGVDPLRIFGSGALLAAVSPDVLDDALSSLAEADIAAEHIGTLRTGDPAVEIDGKAIEDPVRDDLYALWEGE